MRKKIIFAAIIALMAMVPFKSQGQIFNYDPFEGLSMVDSETALLALNVIGEIMAPSRTCLLHEKNETAKGVYEWFIVIEYNGKRFSVYYNFVDYSGDNLLGEFDKQLKIYARPIGTQGLDSLSIICDYYINGSWDRAWMDNQEFDGLSLFEFSSYDRKQEQYVSYLHQVLDYFNK